MTIDYARAYGNERRAHSEMRRRQRAAIALTRARRANQLTSTRRAASRLHVRLGAYVHRPFSEA